MGVTSLTRLLAAVGSAMSTGGGKSSTGQKVAIKVLLTARLAGGKPEVEFERFDREVKFIASLHHPNIVH